MNIQHERECKLERDNRRDYVGEGNQQRNGRFSFFYRLMVGDAKGFLFISCQLLAHYTSNVSFKEKNNSLPIFRDMIAMPYA